VPAAASSSSRRGRRRGARHRDEGVTRL